MHATNHLHKLRWFASKSDAMCDQKYIVTLLVKSINIYGSGVHCVFEWFVTKVLTILGGLFWWLMLRGCDF